MRKSDFQDHLMLIFIIMTFFIAACAFFKTWVEMEHIRTCSCYVPGKRANKLRD